jgi:two-component system, NtrC family, sensor kinase
MLKNYIKRKPSKDDDRKIEELINNTISEIISGVFVKNNIKLNEFIKSNKFKIIISKRLGIEVANFYIYNEQMDQLEFFHEAIPNGLEMQFYFIKRKLANGTFLSNRVRNKDFDERRALQRDFLLNNDEQLTANLCFKNLISNFPKWSKDESKEGWLIIPEGEIIVFTFEYFIRTYFDTNEMDISKKEALRIINNKDDFGKEIWENIHYPEHHAFMRKREIKNFKNMIDWLKVVLLNRNKENYSYLWSSTEQLNSWFTLGEKELKNIINKAETKNIDYNILNNLALLVIKYSYPVNSDHTRIDIKTQKFYNRSRFSPKMELIHGTHNIFAFLFNYNTPIFNVPIRAFLLGTFYDKSVLVKYSKHIRNLFSILAFPNFISHSMSKYNHILTTTRKTEDILKLLSSSFVFHELHNPIGLILSSADIIKDEVKDTEIYPKIEKFIDRIIDKSSRVEFLLRMSRNLNRLALVPKSKVSINSYIHEEIERLEDDGVIPENIKIKTQFKLANNILYPIDRESFGLVIENLIKNSCQAMKDSGSILIKTFSQENTIHISIIDDGPGIPKELRKILFQPLISEKTVKKKGTGLGLFLSKYIVNLLEGDIVLDKIDTGTSFSILLKGADDEESKFSINNR